jgi:hypothetical protein
VQARRGTPNKAGGSSMGSGPGCTLTSPERRWYDIMSYYRGGFRCRREKSP